MFRKFSGADLGWPDARTPLQLCEASAAIVTIPVHVRDIRLDRAVATHFFREFKSSF
jgi:hypothetical protein